MVYCEVHLYWEVHMQKVFCKRCGTGRVYSLQWVNVNGDGTLSDDQMAGLSERTTKTMDNFGPNVGTMLCVKCGFTVDWIDLIIQNHDHGAEEQTKVDIPRRKKPPLGLKPRSIHDEERLSEVMGAVARSFAESAIIPVDWTNELLDLIVGHNARTRASRRLCEARR